jgi:hypothetical protein
MDSHLINWIRVTDGLHDVFEHVREQLAKEFLGASLGCLADQND